MTWPRIFTVAENIFLGAEPKGKLPFTINRAEIVAQAAALASRHGFTVNPTATVATLSTGDMPDCRVAQGAAPPIVHHCHGRAYVVAGSARPRPNDSSVSFAELRAGGLSIVYISHRLDEVADLADDISCPASTAKSFHSSRAADLTIPQIVQHMVGRESDEFFLPKDNAIGQRCACR